MKQRILFFIFMLVNSPFSAFSQWHYQYFDGADTLAINSIFIQLDTSAANVWQIGRPQKTIFNSAATIPNAIITDTIHYYPINNISRFQYKINFTLAWGIMAIQWKQKLDFDKKHDGGIVEFSLDGGTSWQNAFNNPLVYNFYGFDSSNKDTLVTGEYAFSGIDTNWKDIWLCFDMSFLSMYDSVILRYSLKSDSIDSNKEGWLIDNILSHMTLVHTVTKLVQTDYLHVYPTVTSGIVNIEAQKMNQFNIINNIILIDKNGKIVEEYGKCPVKYFIDIRSHPNGTYYLKVETNIKTIITPVILIK